MWCGISKEMPPSRNTFLCCSLLFLDGLPLACPSCSDHDHTVRSKRPDNLWVELNRTSHVTTAHRSMTPSLLSLSSAVRWVSVSDGIPLTSGQLLPLGQTTMLSYCSEAELFCVWKFTWNTASIHEGKKKCWTSSPHKRSFESVKGLGWEKQAGKQAWLRGWELKGQKQNPA